MYTEVKNTSFCSFLFCHITSWEMVTNYPLYPGGVCSVVQFKKNNKTPFFKSPSWLRNNVSECSVNVVFELLDHDQTSFLPLE